jgi:hypothetical protein
MTKNQSGSVLIDALLIIAILAVLAIAFFGPSYTCERQAKIMGMRHNWNFFHGCMIEPKPGQWVPIGNYRVM